jgi:thiazole biosynthesis enzyme
VVNAFTVFVEMGINNATLKLNRRMSKMQLDEILISKAIAERFFKKFADSLSVDVAIVGGGPSGLVAGYYLSKEGVKTVLFERKLSIGGGMWGGGMMFNEIVVQEEGKAVLDVFEVPAEKFMEGYYTADSVLAVSTICSKAMKAGLRVFNLISVEDVMVREDRVTGLVINWTSVEMANLHVDPLAVRARYIIDATGHPAEVVRVIERKMEGKLSTRTGKVIGEGPLWAQVAESKTLENTREVFPGVLVAGMAANATFGSFRMGPVFGGMLLSGKKAAQIILERLKK